MAEISEDQKPPSSQNSQEGKAGMKSQEEPPRKSFASVAAMPLPSAVEQVTSNAAQQPAISANKLAYGPNPRPLKAPSSSTPSSNAAIGTPNSAESPQATTQQHPSDNPKGLTDSLRRLDVRDFRPHLDDEKTHLSVSSMTAPSLDGKSVISGATFGLDEKESIRPDDSASVKAVDDDDSNSGPASADPNSRYGSEAGSKPLSLEISERGQNLKNLHWARRLGQIAAEEPRRVPLIPPNPLNVYQPGQPRPDGESGTAPMVYDYPPIDEKLLAAMDNPKDRLFLLQLERQVVSFIQSTNEPLLDLPPCNSFYRLLAHRLGDYYALSHFVDNSVSAVRLYRTPYCRIRHADKDRRTPLSEVHQKLSSTEEPRPVPLSMKIMRRTEGVTDDQPPSSRSSKAASEVEDEGSKPMSVTSPTESTTARDKAAISREAREAKYREARERIFGDYKEGEKTDPNAADDGGATSSRASSNTGRMKKKNRNDDDSFDSRASYNLYYPASQRSAPFYDQPTNQMGYYASYMPQAGAPMMPYPYQQPYPQYPQVPQMGQVPAYQYAAPPYQMMQMPGMYGAPGNQSPYHQFPQQPRSSYFGSGPPAGGVPNSMSSPSMSNHSSQSSRSPSQQMEQGWGQGAYGYPYNNLHGSPNVYPPSSHMPNQPGAHMASQAQQSTPPAGYSMPSVPYAYGQLPYQPNGQASRPMHPIPGSYNRQHFNPQSKVFVPGQGSGGEMGSRPPFSNSGQGTGKGMTATTPQSLHRTPVSLPQDTISKWAAPATLPPKPPPPASGMPPSFESADTRAAGANEKEKENNPPSQR